MNKVIGGVKKFLLYLLTVAMRWIGGVIFIALFFGALFGILKGLDFLLARGLDFGTFTLILFGFAFPYMVGKIFS